MIIKLKNKDTLICDDFQFKCSIGKNGKSRKKKEGDNKTPIGRFAIENLYYRSDRIKKPFTELKCIKIKKNMGWCDDVNDKNYNKLITINNKIKHERLFRKNTIYDLLIPICYNTKKPIRRKGSAIFIHLTNNYEKTLGCIALKENDLLTILKLIDKKTKIKIL